MNNKHRRCIFDLSKISFGPKSGRKCMAQHHTDHGPGDNVAALTQLVIYARHVTRVGPITSAYFRSWYNNMYCYRDVPKGLMVSHGHGLICASYICTGIRICIYDDKLSSFVATASRFWIKPAVSIPCSIPLRYVKVWGYWDRDHCEPLCNCHAATITRSTGGELGGSDY